MAGLLPLLVGSLLFINKLPKIYGWEAKWKNTLSLSVSAGHHRKGLIIVISLTLLHNGYCTDFRASLLKVDLVSATY